MTKNRCTVTIDKEAVTRLIRLRYNTINSFVKAMGVSRVRYYQILNESHMDRNVPSIKKMAMLLMTSTKSITKEN